MKNALKTLLICLLICSCSQMTGKTHDYYLIIGTYTTGKSEGIYVYKFNSNTGEVFYVSTVSSISNPSYVSISPNDKYVYSVSELPQKDGVITAYLFDHGKMTKLNEQNSGGESPCYVMVDGSGKWLAAGNYSSGTFSVFPINGNGSIGKAINVIKDTGKSVNASRQEKPHVHSTIFSQDNNYLFVPDLGIDKVMVYAFHQETGKLDPANPPFVTVAPGSGPRHFIFDPTGKFAYLIEELSGNVAVFKYEGNGKLTAVQSISAIPSDYKGSIGSADIHISPDDKFLYASNRGESNTIAIFSIDTDDGMLKLVGHQSVLGKTPRNFNIDPLGNFLLVANQNSDNIVIFKIDKATGKLSALDQQIKVPNPVCIKFIPVR